MLTSCWRAANYGMDILNMTYCTFHDACLRSTSKKCSLLLRERRGWKKLHKYISISIHINTYFRDKLRCLSCGLRITQCVTCPVSEENSSLYREAACYYSLQLQQRVVFGDSERALWAFSWRPPLSWPQLQKIPLNQWRASGTAGPSGWEEDEYEDGGGKDKWTEVRWRKKRKGDWLERRNRMRRVCSSAIKVENEGEKKKKRLGIGEIE